MKVYQIGQFVILYRFTTEWTFEHFKDFLRSIYEVLSFHISAKRVYFVDLRITVSMKIRETLFNTFEQYLYITLKREKYFNKIVYRSNWSQMCKNY